MSKEDRKEMAEKLNIELEAINTSQGVNINKYVINPKNALPDFEKLEIYNYEKEESDAYTLANKMITALGELYFSEIEGATDNIYIKMKMREDSNIYADTLFLQKMSKKNYVSILKQIDNGDNNSRMYDTANSTAHQIRENIKFSTTLKTNMEDYYKKLRDDLLEGLKLRESNSSNKIESNEFNDEDSENTSEVESTKVVDNREINNMINNAIIAKREAERNKK